MTDDELNQYYDQMTFSVPQVILELQAGLFLDKLNRLETV